jgi:hypothetical protein
LRENLSLYGEHVRNHQSTQDVPFLSYPTCLRGHYFHIKEVSIANECDFNYRESEDHYFEELEIYQGLTDDFREGGIIPSLELLELEEREEGMMGTSLLSRLNLTKQLLNKAGYEPEFFVANS